MPVITLSQSNEMLRFTGGYLLDMGGRMFFYYKDYSIKVSRDIFYESFWLDIAAIIFSVDEIKDHKIIWC